MSGKYPSRSPREAVITRSVRDTINCLLSWNPTCQTRPTFRLLRHHDEHILQRRRYGPPLPLIVRDVQLGAKRGFVERVFDQQMDRLAKQRGVTNSFNVA